MLFRTGQTDAHSILNKFLIIRHFLFVCIVFTSYENDARQYGGNHRGVPEVIVFRYGEFSGGGEIGALAVFLGKAIRHVTAADP